MSTGQGGWLERIHAFFNHPGLRKFWCRIRFPVAVILLVLLALFVQQEWFWIGLAVSLLGEFIQLWCFADNLRARAFYEKHGFVAVEFTEGAGNEEKTPDTLYRWTR